MDEKSKEVLETPQVHLFKHENVFGNSFKEEITKAPDFLRSNSIIDVPTLSTMSTTLNSTSSLNFNNSFPMTVNSTFNNNSAPKKNLLFRTISQSDNELQRQDSVKVVDSLNTSSGYYSSQNSSGNSIFSMESTDQSYNPLTNTNHKSNTANLKLLSEISSNSNLHLDQNNNLQSNSLKRKNMDMNKMSEDFNKSNTSLCYSKEAKFISKIGEISILPNTKKTNGLSYLDMQRAPNGNKISALIQNELFYTESSMNSKTNGFLPNQLISKSRSSSSSNDDIVTSSDQNMGNKLKPKRSIMLNTDVRKQQIRNSNREAARRCRERRRNYIETLEANIRVLECEKKTLINENSSLKSEVVQLKKTLCDRRASGNLEVNSNENNNISNEKNKHNNFRLVNNNENITSIAGVPVVLTLNLPNIDIESANNISTLSKNDNNITINNQHVLEKLLSALVSSNKTNSPPLNNNNDYANSIELKSQQSLN